MDPTLPAKTFVNAVTEFLNSAEPWLSPEDAPAVAALQAAARELDKEVTSALLNSYGLMYRSLLKRKPTRPAEVDELERLLRESSE